MYKLIKQFFAFVIVIAISLLLLSCIESEKPNVKPPVDTKPPITVEPSEGQLNLFYLNDTHGAVLKSSNELGLANIANYIITKQKELVDQTVFVTGGDMLQGQLISNTNKGAVMIESLNEMNLDAFVIGNHEFDWGLDIVLDYFNDTNQDVKANFPLLGANVIEKATNERPKGIDSHVIINRNKLRIGIIGAIGNGQESSINYRRVEPYKFTDAFDAIYDTVEEIKDDVDLILVGVHDSNDDLNSRISRLSKVQTIFNAHEHSSHTDEYYGVPILKSGSNARAVGEIVLDYKNNNNGFSVLDYSISNVINSPLFNVVNKEVQAIVNKYYEPIKHLYTDVIITAGESMDRKVLANYIAKVMKTVTGSVAGFQNSGGTRNQIYRGQQLTAADIFQVFPFDNEIVYTKVPGYYLKTLLNDTYFYKSYDININEINNNELYKVATNDYVFYSKYNNFLEYQQGTQEVYGDMYEVFVGLLKELQKQGHNEFTSNSPILIGPNQIDFANYHYFNKESYEVLYV